MHKHTRTFVRLRGRQPPPDAFLDRRQKLKDHEQKGQLPQENQTHDQLNARTRI